MSTTDPPSNGPSTPPVPPQLSGITYSGGTPTGTTGNLTEDIPKALKQINVTEDFKRLPQMPCVRDALLYGIASGAGVGAIRFMSAGPRKAANWAMGTFLLVSLAAHEVCRKERAEELGVMRHMMEKYPERHAKLAKERALARMAAEKEAKGNADASNTP